MSEGIHQSAGKKEGEGLCVNCTNLDSCTLPDCGKGNVLHCEEYYCESGECAQASPLQNQLTSKPGGPEPSNLKGLCVNCDQRFDCTFKKPPGGIWHCGEYQ
ncbi:MAG: hypothetical protein ACYTHM_05700 [Planctomycetota bacterium]